MQGRLWARVLAVAGATGCAAQLAPIAEPEAPARRQLGSVAKASQAEPQASVSPPPSGPCPESMALVEQGKQRFCIDRYEASLEHVTGTQHEKWPGNRRIDGLEAEMVAVSRASEKPQGYVSGAQAQAACTNAGKRLCEREEWLMACRGPKNTLYPYGDERRPNVCNDRFKTLDHHPVVTLFREHAAPDADPRTMWMPRWMNDPRLHEMPHTVALTGEFAECTNEYGVYDMVGNLHEWIDDPEGTFVGGFFMDTFQNGEGCSYRTFGHEFEYHDYSTGFRCCAEPGG
jgi:formylglycine-generating enzyme